MSRKTDVLVIGSGAAGLTAAYAAAKKGARVKLVCDGMGCLAISGGSIDLLGYDREGNRLANPYDGFAALSPEHPYSIAGAEKTKEALKEFGAALKSKGYELKAGADAGGAPQNTLVPTIMGTLKPTYLYDAAQSPEALVSAKKVLVTSVKGFRECRSRLVIDQLRRYPELENIDFKEKVLPAPFPEYGRSLTALDLAHFADTTRGLEWMREHLRGLGENYDLVLLPPIIGAKASSPVRKEAEEIMKAPFAEMLSLPPGVQGIRLRSALIGLLEDMDVEFYENSQAGNAKIENGICVELESASTNRRVIHKPGTIVAATGGIISGGVSLKQGLVEEAVFGLPIAAPRDVEEWSSKDIFGEHLFSRMGVKTDNNFRPVNNSGEVLINNVFFAGGTLGGYDYAREKSGHGTAIATGWIAGCLAAEEALNNARNQAGAN
ncbi:MAG: anaerobic glycerol-3-phosphate dehydrogenase subunit B [Desulfovibrio sp.]|nr:anaerobic glycerol-3-phosphate dehydrogenase subunit B [Desulfovibrio sp.]